MAAEKGPASHPAGLRAVSGGDESLGFSVPFSAHAPDSAHPTHFVTALVLDVHILRVQPDTFPGLALFLLCSLACTKG